MKVWPQSDGWLAYCPGCKTHHEFDRRWQFNGQMELPTFTPSLNIYSERRDPALNHRCHSYLTNGLWIYLSDCTHEFAGQNVPAPDIDTTAMMAQDAKRKAQR